MILIRYRDKIKNMFDVLTIGTATRDVFFTSSLFKVLKDPEHLKKLGFKTGEAECFAFGSKLELGKPLFETGGGAVNAALTFARQGLRTATLIKIGDDGLGKEVLNTLKTERINVFAALDKKGGGTAYSTILLSPNGERTVLTYRGASEKLEKRDVPFRKLEAKWAYIAPGKIQPSLIELIIIFLKRKGMKIAINPSGYYVSLGYTKLKNIFKKADVVIMNREEASIFTEMDFEDEDGIFKQFDGWIDGMVVMTNGHKGVMVSDGHYIYKAGIFKEKKLVDRTGAGDAFGAAFVTGLMQKKGDINYALRLASANATSVVEAIGAQTGILSKKDIEQKRFKYLDLDVEPL